MKCQFCLTQYHLSMHVFYGATKIICEFCGRTMKNREVGEISNQKEFDLSKRGFYFSCLESLEKAACEQLKFNLRFNKKQQPKFHLI